MVEYTQDVKVTSERTNIEEIHFGKTMTIFFSDDVYAEYEYNLINTNKGG